MNREEQVDVVNQTEYNIIECRVVCKITSRNPETLCGFLVNDEWDVEMLI